MIKKSIKLSREEKSLIRTLLIFILIQAILIVGFIMIYQISTEDDSDSVHTTDIIIEDIYFDVVTNRICLVVVSDSAEYLFFDTALERGEYSTSKLHKVLSIGDHLSIIYKDDQTFFGKEVKWIFDARGETEVYRWFDFSNQEHKFPVAWIVVFSILESLLGGVVWFVISLNTDVIKGISQKITKRKTGDGSLS